MKNYRYILTGTALFTLLILTDQAAKYMIRSLGGFYVCNKGVAFGLDVPLIVLWTLIIILCVLVISNWKFVISNLKIKKNPNYKLPITSYGFVLILAGAISNIADRLYFGCIIDFIDLGFWPLFNLADILITTGAIMLLITNLKIKSEK